MDEAWWILRKLLEVDSGVETPKNEALLQSAYVSSTRYQYAAHAAILKQNGFPSFDGLPSLERTLV